MKDYILVSVDYFNDNVFSLCNAGATGCFIYFIHRVDENGYGKVCLNEARGFSGLGVEKFNKSLRLMRKNKLITLKKNKNLYDLTICNFSEVVKFDD